MVLDAMQESNQRVFFISDEKCFLVAGKTSSFVGNSEKGGVFSAGKITSTMMSDVSPSLHNVG